MNHRAIQKPDNQGSGHNLDSVQKNRKRAIKAQQPTIGHWLQISPRERRLVKGATKEEQKAYLLGLKRELFDVEKEYFKTLTFL